MKANKRVSVWVCGYFSATELLPCRVLRWLNLNAVQPLAWKKLLFECVQSLVNSKVCLCLGRGLRSRCAGVMYWSPQCNSAGWFWQPSLWLSSWIVSADDGLLAFDVIISALWGVIAARRDPSFIVTRYNMGWQPWPLWPFARKRHLFLT